MISWREDCRKSTFLTAHQTIAHTLPTDPYLSLSDAAIRTPHAVLVWGDGPFH